MLTEVQSCQIGTSIGETISLIASGSSPEYVPNICSRHHVSNQSARQFTADLNINGTSL